jgi:hypothetical protein
MLMEERAGAANDFLWRGCERPKRNCVVLPEIKLVGAMHRALSVGFRKAALIWLNG